MTASADYTLKIEHPRTGETAREDHDTLPAVVARAAELIKAGYVIGICALESQPAKTTAECDEPTRFRRTAAVGCGPPLGGSETGGR